MFATDAWIIERAGVHRSTVTRWRRTQCFPPALERLARVELEGELECIHPAWCGWRIDRAGALIAPGGMRLEPAELLALPVRYQLLRELAKPPRRRPPVRTILTGHAIRWVRRALARLRRPRQPAGVIEKHGAHLVKPIVRAIDVAS